jgi:hypothetical protein
VERGVPQHTKTGEQFSTATYSRPCHNEHVHCTEWSQHLQRSKRAGAPLFLLPPWVLQHATHMYIMAAIQRSTQVLALHYHLPGTVCIHLQLYGILYIPRQLAKLW